MSPIEDLNLVVAYIRPSRLESVVDALREISHFPGMTVSDVRGFGPHQAHPPHAGERSEVNPFDRAVRIEIFCRSQGLRAIVDRLAEVARTGHVGDGRIFVLPVESARSIESGAEGSAALDPEANSR